MNYSKQKMEGELMKNNIGRNNITANNNGVYKILCLFIMVFIATTLTFAASSSSSSSDANSKLVKVTLLSQSPDPAVAGETVELRFKIENLGGQTANNIDLELMPKFPFNKIQDENYATHIDSISGYQQGVDAIIVKYKVLVSKDAMKGTNTIDLKETMQSGLSQTSDVTSSYDVEVTTRELVQIGKIDKSILKPGEETEITFTVSNIGNSPLQNIIFSWNEENGYILPVFSDDTKYVKFLDVGKSVDVTYTVVAGVNLNPGLYQLNIIVKFDTASGSTSQLTTKTGIFIGGPTDFDVTTAQSSQGQTTFSVANTGNNPATAVTVSIPTQEGFSVTGATSSIVGNLDKGDYTVVSFQISSFGGMAGAGTTGTGVGTSGGQRVRNITDSQRQQMIGNNTRNMPSANSVKVQIDYTDTTGKRVTLQKNVPLQLSSGNITGAMGSFAGTRGQITKSTPIWQNPIFLIIACIVLVIVSWNMGKSKGKKIAIELKVKQKIHD